ncbi:MAG: pyruvate dehydrogenase (acetyl-transferring), homodimeric type [Gammaproteobacteria bacterium]|nr:pyruvate dehydrogenase (acetyl-transferring), homodimeric type [Gammaproteobacteria bacterium]
MATENTQQPTLDDDFIAECNEWLESLDFIHQHYGEKGVSEIIKLLRSHALNHAIPLSKTLLNTPYRNTIPSREEPPYPGNISLEERLEQIVRWNAMAMVVRAADGGSGVGGHIATHASAATLMEVGQHHFFRCRDDNFGGDLVMLQPATSPAIYARAWMEGRLETRLLENYRRELQPGGGLPSYCHPRLMPTFWQIPSASMGLASPAAIYQARFNRYLENRGLKPANGGKVWCFIGDGETDEPEVLGTINIAAREKLDNLILVINCNLQSLDGPVRGNGKIIQELERSFHGADWNVIKVIWGGDWDHFLAEDHDGQLQQRMNQALDGDYQYLSISSGEELRRFWTEGDPQLATLLNRLSDDELLKMQRGGQDRKKIYSAYHKALQSKGRPTVILIKTVKGDGMGSASQGRNTTHIKKQLNIEERRNYAQQLQIPLSKEAIDRADFYRPDNNSPEMNYLHQQRKALGGYLPRRTVACPTLTAPPLSFFAEFTKGTGERAVSTTMAMVRMLGLLLKEKRLGPYLVPIVPDEARTFGLDALFKSAGIYSHNGQKYTPVDHDSLLSYHQVQDGQILQEGICEIGAISSFMAAGTAYATHGIPTVPFYFFYSMFGFQRIGDMIWACGDMLTRGFLLGGTAGRTTLNGEGLQHQDGHSQILASTIPGIKSYDPAFAHELAVIIRDGIHRMYELQQNHFYYITIYNENYPMPMVADIEPIEEGILRGIYCYQQGDVTQWQGPKVHLLASGPIMQQAIEARALLKKMNIDVDIWSVTSYNELFREAVEAERWNRLHPTATPRTPYLTEVMNNETGVFIAASDYMKSLPLSIAPWIPGRYQVLGTDGFGMSEARPELRDHFEIDARFITVAALHALAQEGAIKSETVADAIKHFAINPEKRPASEV